MADLRADLQKKLDYLNRLVTNETEDVVNEIKIEDSNIKFYRFEEFGTSSIYIHPNVAEAAASAEELKPVIAEFMGW